MDGAFAAVKVSDRVWWVGAVDWGIRNFHGYLILADEITLVDTVKAPFADEMLSRIASVVEPSRIGVIAPDHGPRGRGSGTAGPRRC